MAGIYGLGRVKDGKTWKVSIAGLSWTGKDATECSKTG